MSRPIRPWRDRSLGWLVSRLGTVALSSFPAYAAMVHGPWLTSHRRARFGALRARAAFLHAHHDVPAYRDFVATHASTPIRYFEDVPITSKDDYIRRYPLEATLRGGRLPTRGAVIDESSGSTGMPSNWVRGPVEREATQRLIQYASRATVGRDDFILLNAFALGPWATGMNVSMAMVDATVVKSVGPDVDKIVNTLALLGPRHHYVICGYPPFLKVLADDARLDWSTYTVTAIVGGEGMSEELRAYLRRSFDAVVSSFGASDLEINLALESPWSVAVRQAMRQTPTIVERLTGRSGGLPMVFQYDPTQVFVENGPDDHLLFTLCRLENVSPRIRYDLCDRGRVVPFAEVARVCREEGVALPRATTELPVLLHWGREEQAVVFYGSKVTPEHIQAALFRVPSLRSTVEHYGLRVFEDDAANARLEVVMELGPDATAPPHEAEAAFFEQLAEVNQDFREARRMVPRDLAPRLTVEAHGESRLSGQDDRIKRRYVVA